MPFDKHQMSRTDYIAAFLRYAEVNRGFSKLTLETYSCDLRLLETYLLQQDEVLDWTLVDRDRIRLWMAARMESGVKPQTVKRSLSSLRTFFRYLLENEIIERDPMRFIVNPKTPRLLPTVVRASEINHLLDDVPFPETFEGFRDRLVLLTLYSCGLRISELLGLDVENVDLNRSELRVLGKRNKHRVVPFGEELRNELRVYLDLRAEELQSGAVPAEAMTAQKGAFFVNVARGKIRRLNYTAASKKVKYYLGLVTTQKKRSPHVLRHTFATTLLNNGADLEAVRDLLGHERVTTTQIYTHASFAELAKIYSNAHPHGKDDGSADSGEKA